MQESPCNLIASKKGRIASILVRSGSAKVKKGDKVKPGDVLISGIVEIKDDERNCRGNLGKGTGRCLCNFKIKYEDCFH